MTVNPQTFRQDFETIVAEENAPEPEQGFSVEHHMDAAMNILDTIAPMLDRAHEMTPADVQQCLLAFGVAQVHTALVGAAANLALVDALGRIERQLAKRP